MIVQVFNPCQQLADVHRRQLGDVLAVEPEMQRFAVEAGAREELPCPLLGGAGRGVVLLHLDILD